MNPLGALIKLATFLEVCPGNGMMDSHVEETVSNTRDGTDRRAKKGRKRKAKNNATALVESKKV